MADDRTIIVTEPMALLPFLLAKQPGVGRNKVKAMLTRRQVKVDGSVVTRHDSPLQSGQRVTIQGSRIPPAGELQGIQILFEDAHIIVIDKPAGLLSIATEEERENTAYRVLMEHVQSKNPRQRVFVVHRLDRETSGVMMYAKREEIQQTLQNNWKEMVLERAYLAVVEGRFASAEGTVTSWLKETSTHMMYVSKPGDGLKAVTHYRVLKTGGEYSLLEVRLETGRKNQIRVQMQNIGHSVAGDKRYKATKNPMDRLGLHAHVLAFHHPVTQEIMRYETDVPKAFRKLFLNN